MKVIQKKDVVTFVADEVVKAFKDATTVPNKLDIQRCIGQVTDGVVVDMGTKVMQKHFELEDGTKGTRPEVVQLPPKPLIDYYTKISLSEVKAIQEQIQKEIAKIRFPTITEEGDPVQLLKELKDFGWYIQADEIPTFVLTLLRMMAYMKREQPLDGFKYAEGIYLKGEVEGTGKSTLLNAIMRGFQDGGYKVADDVSWPSKFSNVLPFANNNLVIIPDCDPNKKKEVSEEKMKHILRKEFVENEMKGVDAVPVEAQAALMAAGNCEPPVAKDRCWRVFDILGADTVGEFGKTSTFQKIRETVVSKYGLDEKNWKTPSVYKFYNFYTFYHLLLKKEKEIESKKICKKEKQVIKTGDGVSLPHNLIKRLKYLPNLLEVLQKMQSGSYNFSNLSIKQIDDFQRELPTYKQLDPYYYYTTLKTLAGNGIVNQLNRQTNYVYVHFNLKGLEEVSPSDLYNEEAFEIEKGIEEQVQDSLAMWDELIEYVGTHYPTDPKPEGKPKGDPEIEIDFDKEIDAFVAKDNRLFNSTFEYTNEKGERSIGFNKPERVNKLQEYITVNETIDPEKISRKNEDMHGTNYLLEMDDIPKEEQKELIQNLPQEVKRAIHWVCDSGNKSIHTVIVTDTDTNKTNEREAVLSYINKTYFKGHLDMSAKNAGRLGRNPNGIRKNGNRQTLYYYNNNPKPLSVGHLVEDARKNFDIFLSNLKRTLDQTHSKDPLTVETLQKRRETPGRNKAIDMLNGICDWEGMTSACMYLLSTGFERDEIEEAVGYGDEWLPKALDTAEKYITK